MHSKKQHQLEVHKHSVLPGYLVECKSCSWKDNLILETLEQALQSARQHGGTVPVQVIAGSETVTYKAKSYLEGMQNG